MSVINLTIGQFSQGLEEDKSYRVNHGAYQDGNEAYSKNADGL